MKRTLILLTVLVFILTGNAGAQQLKKINKRKKTKNEFSYDKDKYMTEISAFFLKPNPKDKKVQAYLSKFEAIWNRDFFSEMQRRNIYLTSNMMFKKNARANPHFIAYFNLLMFFAEQSQDTTSYNEWSQILIYLCSRKDYRIRNVQDFFETSAKLFEENSLYKTKSLNWTAKTKFAGDTGVVNNVLKYHIFFDKPTEHITDSIYNEYAKDTLVEVSETPPPPKTDPSADTVKIVDYMAGMSFDDVPAPVDSTSMAADSTHKDSTVAEFDKDKKKNEVERKRKQAIIDKILKDRYIKSLRVEYENVNLVCNSVRDSVFIRNTSGIYYPFAKIFVGKGGRVTWERVGFPRDSVYADVKNYKLTLTLSELTADSVSFTNKYYKIDTLLGKLDFKIMAGMKQEKANYPRFDSYKKNIELKQVLKDIDYKGGFTMRGQKFYGSGIPGTDATVNVYRGDSVFLKTSAQLYIFTKEKIESSSTAIKFCFSNDSISPKKDSIPPVKDSISLAKDTTSHIKDTIAFVKDTIVHLKKSIPQLKDSITHQSLTFRYYNGGNVKRKNRITGLDTIIKVARKVELINVRKGSENATFMDSYHNLKMDFEMLTWYPDSAKLELSMLPGSARNIGYFQSKSYFNQGIYLRLQGLDKVHPLIALKNYSKKNKKRTFSAKELNKYYTTEPSLKLSLENYQVKQMLIRLSTLGFVNYDWIGDKGTINQYLFDYLEYNNGKKDYDNIVFESNTKRTVSNATVDFKTMDLIVRGVKSINISDSQQVYIFPDHESVTVKKNRDMKFDGVVVGGLLDFFGTNFYFSYDTFKIAMPVIDSLKVNILADIPSPDPSRPLIADVHIPIVKSTGFLQIDLPNNKSSIKKTYDYPVYHSLKDCYVYYDGIDSAYKRSGGVDSLLSIAKKTYQDSIRRQMEYIKYDTTLTDSVRAARFALYGDTTMRHADTRDKEFSFRLYPFTVKSIDKLHRESWKIRGMFKSGGILPNFEYNLTIQDDAIVKVDSIRHTKKTKTVYSLGFLRSAREQLPLFGGKGASEIELKLSVLGFRGRGKIYYYTSNAISENFRLFPDSIVAMADQFNTKEQVLPVEYPSVRGRDISIMWRPYSDIMTARSTKYPFMMYEKYTSDQNDTVQLDGRLEVRPKGMFGGGDINFSKSLLTADKITFLHHVINADTSAFQVGSEKGAAISFQNDNVNSHIDFADKYGIFKLNDKAKPVYMRKNQYICYLDQFKWMMNKTLIDVEKTVDTDTSAYYANDNTNTPQIEEERIVRGARFISIHPNQDSLSFIAETSTFDYEKNLIVANNVKLMHIADVTVYPSSSVYIDKNARMRRLRHAKIIANRFTRYHTIFNATINVYPEHRDVDTLTGHKARSINYFSASGDYYYTDMQNKKQKIFFDEISVDSSRHTFANGVIPDSAKFALSPYFEFKGKVKLEADTSTLIFNGHTRIHHKCESISKDWLPFKNYISPTDVLIPITQNPFAEGYHLFSNIFLTNEDPKIYSAFLSPKKKWSDSTLLYALGFMRYDTLTGLYNISSRKKLDNLDLPGNYLSLNGETCDVYGEGDVKFGVNLGQIKLTTVGTIAHNLPSAQVEMNMMLGIDFFFNSKALGVVATKAGKVKKSSGIDMTKDVFKKNLTQLTDSARAQDLLARAALKGQFKDLPFEMRHSLMFSDVKFMFNYESHSFKSVGKLGLSNIFDDQINRYIDGYIEIVKKRSGDQIYLYLQPSKNNWFYFSYASNLMQAFSSLDEFNTMITKTKEKDRKTKPPGAKFTYTYALSNEKMKKKFIANFTGTEALSDSLDTQDLNEPVLDNQTEANDSSVVTKPVKKDKSKKIKVKDEEPVIDTSVVVEEPVDKTIKTKKEEPKIDTSVVVDKPEDKTVKPKKEEEKIDTSVVVDKPEDKTVKPKKEEEKIDTSVVVDKPVDKFIKPKDDGTPKSDTLFKPPSEGIIRKDSIK